MLIVLRILFGAALLYELIQGARIAPSTIGEAGDVTGAFYLAVCVGLGILNALVWAPYFGSLLSRPLTGTITETTYVERINWVLRLARWAENRGWRRAALSLSFLEAVRHPSAPTPFVMGFRNARPGSWLEKVFAREVFRFNNIQNCVQAYLALKRHGIDPRPHASQEINIVLLSMEREPHPEPAILAVPAARKTSALKRNPRIRLFEGAQTTSRAPDSPDEAKSTATSPPRIPDPASENAMTQRSATGAERPASARWFSSLLARVVAFLKAE